MQFRISSSYFDVATALWKCPETCKTPCEFHLWARKFFVLRFQWLDRPSKRDRLRRRVQRLARTITENTFYLRLRGNCHVESHEVESAENFSVLSRNVSEILEKISSFFSLFFFFFLLKTNCFLKILKLILLFIHRLK